MNDMMEISRRFFRLPESERLKSYSEDPTKTVRLSTSFNVKKEKVSNWRDYLRLHCYPLEDYVQHWPSQPSNFRFAFCLPLKHNTVILVYYTHSYTYTCEVDKKCNFATLTGKSPVSIAPG